MTGMEDNPPMDSKTLIERVRVFTERKTDYAVAKALEMTQTHLIRVKSGDMTLGPRAIVRVAEITGEPLSLILAIVEREKARSPAAVRFWEARLPRSMAPVVAQAPANDPIEPQTEAEELRRMYKTLNRIRSQTRTRTPPACSPWGGRLAAESCAA